eukprot:gene2661-3494_t
MSQVFQHMKHGDNPKPSVVDVRDLASLDLHAIFVTRKLRVALVRLNALRHKTCLLRHVHKFPAPSTDIQQGLTLRNTGLTHPAQAILATRDALAQQKQATAAGLLPKLSLFAAGGTSTSNATISNITIGGGGCCGSSLLPDSTTNSWDWSLGLTINWLLFDAGTTSGEARALAKREAATMQRYAAQRNDIRLRLEQAFFNHEASLAKLASARRAVSASMDAVRD